MIFKYWNDQCVIYQHSSGDTHLLSRTNAKILELLRLQTPEQVIIDYIMSESIASNVEDASNILEVTSKSFDRLNLLLA